MTKINFIVRGAIVNTGDPEGNGRVQVRIPTMPGTMGTWAPVCRAIGAPAPGGIVGRQVWVAFENGDRDYPVVLGLAN